MERAGCKSSPETARVENYFEADSHLFVEINKSLHWGLHGDTHTIN